MSSNNMTIINPNFIDALAVKENEVAGLKKREREEKIPREKELRKIEYENYLVLKFLDRKFPNTATIETVIALRSSSNREFDNVFRKARCFYGLLLIGSALNVLICMRLLFSDLIFHLIMPTAVAAVTGAAMVFYLTVSLIALINYWCSYIDPKNTISLRKIRQLK